MNGDGAKSALHNWLAKGPVRVNMFVGDTFITVSRDDEMRIVSLKLDAGSDVRSVVNDDLRFRRTKQFRAMAFLGFRQLDRSGSRFLNESVSPPVWLSFDRGHIGELVVGGVHVKSHVMVDVQYDVALAQLYFDAIHAHEEVKRPTVEERIDMNREFRERLRT